MTEIFLVYPHPVHEITSIVSLLTYECLLPNPFQFNIYQPYFSTTNNKVFQPFNSRHTEQGAKIVKVHHQFSLKRYLIIKKRVIKLCLKQISISWHNRIHSFKIVLKNLIAKIIIIVLFIKIMPIMDFYYFFIPRFIFSRFFSIFPKFSLHTWGPFSSHQCAEAHLLKIAAV
jgi:hypothetical protein